MIGTRIAGVLLCGVFLADFLAGCAGAHAFRVARSETIGPCQTGVPERDTLLGVALSGGGSRAALFGLAGLEAVAGVRMPDGTSVIDKISHLSSVSGGSLAATHYALKKPGRDVKVLNADGTLSDAYRTFFEQYRTDLSQDFETSLIWRQLLSFRWVNSAPGRQDPVGDPRRAALRRGPHAGSQRAGEGGRPGDHHLPAEAFDYDFSADLERSLQHRGRAMEDGPSIRERWKLLRPMTPIEIHIDPCPAHLRRLRGHRPLTARPLGRHPSASSSRLRSPLSRCPPRRPV
jgi:hypothetical protein